MWCGEAAFSNDLSTLFAVVENKAALVAKVLDSNYSTREAGVFPYVLLDTSMTRKWRRSIVFFKLFKERESSKTTKTSY